MSRPFRLRPVGFIEPCLPSTAAKPPSGPGWLHEIKHDGYRIMAWRAADRVRLLTRNRSDFGERFPLVTEAIGGLPARSCVIDGEITVCDAQGLSVFELLRHGPRVKRNAVLFAFDLLELDGVS
jgi:bifunctional non-homologous end joining protein LigD